jgi:hypothetical protein
VQYYFKDGEEHPVESARHGNSTKSTRLHQNVGKHEEFIGKSVEKEEARDAVHQVVRESSGGVTSCAGVGQLPRGRQQASDLKRNRQRAKLLGSRAQKNMSGHGRTDDPWYLLLNASKQQSLNKETAFIRDVRVGGEPLCVLASNWQLNDIKRFCCDQK